MIDRIATKEAEQLVAEGKYKTIEEALSQAEKDCNACKDKTLSEIEPTWLESDRRNTIKIGL